MRINFLRKALFLCQLFLLSGVFAAGQKNQLTPGSLFREYSYNKMLSPFKGPFDHKDSIVATLIIDDLDKACGAEMAMKFWGGHIGTSNQVFKVNNGEKHSFPQPDTPGNPYCYYRTMLGNPAVPFDIKDLKNGENTFTFYCGDQICYGFNWPHYWIYFFKIRVYYNETKNLVKAHVVKETPTDTAYNQTGIQTIVSDSSQVMSVEYIGNYSDYDLDGDGKQKGWHYWLDLDGWHGGLGKRFLPPYTLWWENNWLPEQEEPIQIVAKINLANGLCYITKPIEFKYLKQENSKVKLYQCNEIGEAFGVRVGQYRECKIELPDDPSKAVAAYLVFSSWSGESEDGKPHIVGINGKILAESPGLLHDWSFNKIPVPIDYLKQGENRFFVYSDTDGHMFEINYPGPAILLRFNTEPYVPAWSGFKVDTIDGSLSVTFGNSEYFKAVIRENEGGDCGREHAIRDFYLKKAGNVEIVENFIDACAQRGPLCNCEVTDVSFKQLSFKLSYSNCNNSEIASESEYTIYRDKPFIKIDYLKYTPWTNSVDIVSHGGKEADKNAITRVYGQQNYIRPLVYHEESYWNRFDPEYLKTDPENGGTLNYKGYLIMLVASSENGVGFGRIMPIKTDHTGGVKILKLLWNKGFETFSACGEHKVREPFTGYIFGFTNGVDSAMEQARQFIDEL